MLAAAVVALRIWYGLLRHSSISTMSRVGLQQPCASRWRGVAKPASAKKRVSRSTAPSWWRSETLAICITRGDDITVKLGADPGKTHEPTPLSVVLIRRTWRSSRSASSPKKSAIASAPNSVPTPSAPPPPSCESADGPSSPGPAMPPHGRRAAPLRSYVMIDLELVGGSRTGG